MKHSRNLNITFVEEDHSYFIHNQKVKYSVTEFISLFFPKFNSKEVIDTWHSHWQSNENSKYYGMAKEEIAQYWKRNSKKASNEGTNLHKAIELYETKGIISELKEFRQYLEFRDDFDEFEIISSEWIIYDEELNIAGTIDCIARIGEEYFIFDWKRTKEIKEVNREDALFPINHLSNSAYWKYSLQLNMYKYIIEKWYDILISGMYLVSIHPLKENYEVKKVSSMNREIEDLIKIVNNGENSYKSSFEKSSAKNYF